VRFGISLLGASPVTIIQQPFGAADALTIESGTFLVLAADLRAVFFVLTAEAPAAFFFDLFRAVFGNWWRANEIIMRHLSHQTDARYRSRDNTLNTSPIKNALGHVVRNLTIAHLANARRLMQNSEAVMAAGRTFISYSRNDEGASFAADLRKQLEAKDLSVWQDIVALEGGRDWWSQIEDALKSRTLQHFVLVVTPASLASPVVRREIRLARQEGKTVCPVKGPGLGDLNQLPRWIGQLYADDIGHQNRR
jgi:hypothetical protein